MITKTIWNRNPFAELERLAEDLDRTFENSNRANGRSGGFFPIDLYEKDDTLYVRASAPGIAPENLSLTLDANVLTLKGASEAAWKAEGDAKIYRHENHYGEFSRSIRLPEGLDLDNIEATFDNGFVSIALPKVAPAAPQVRQIPVRAASAPTSVEE